MAIRTENQIYADIIGFVNQFLIDRNIQGWQVLQLNQPVKLTEINPTIWVSVTNRTQRGWQYRKYKGFKQSENFTQTQKFKQEKLVQFSALRERLTGDTVNTINSTDILINLKSYLLSTGLSLIKSKGYSIYQPLEIQTPSFQNDSDNFEFMPFFQVTFILEQSLEFPQEHINEYIIKNIEGV